MSTKGRRALGTLVLTTTLSALVLGCGGDEKNPDRPDRKGGEGGAGGRFTGVNPGRSLSGMDPRSSHNNLKQIGMAFHSYSDANRTLPPHATYVAGKPALSWRVALLPNLGEQALYQRFNQNEPWDGPTNKKLASQMPRIYELPGSNGRETGTTYYQVFVGPDALFQPARGGGNPPKVRLFAIADGTSNTILVAEGKKAVPWTKPEDLVFDRNGPLPEVGGFYRSGHSVLFADGAVKVLRGGGVDEKTMRALITPRGGEVVTLP